MVGHVYIHEVKGKLYTMRFICEALPLKHLPNSHHFSAIDYLSTQSKGNVSFKGKVYIWL